VTADSELLARSIHDDYVRRGYAKGQTSADDASLVPWEGLPETLRESNRSQAADIDRKLAAISCEVIPEVGGGTPVVAFTDEEVDLLGRLEHDRWMEERLASGWTLGPSKDVDEKHSPYLVAWDVLSEDIRDLDRDTVRQIPRFLAALGYTVVRRRRSDRNF
jgi:RyR domain